VEGVFGPVVCVCAGYGFSVFVFPCGVFHVIGRCRVVSSRRSGGFVGWW